MMREKPDKDENVAAGLLAQCITSLGTLNFPDHLAAWIKSVLATDNVLVVAYFRQRPPEALFMDSRHTAVHRCIESVYLQGAYLLDPFYELHVTQAAEGVYRLLDVAPDHFWRSQYVEDYYNSTTIIDELAFSSNPAEGVSIHVCAGRDATSRRKFSKLELVAAERIAPIITAFSHANWFDLAGTKVIAETNVPQDLIERCERERGVKLSKRQAEVALFILKGHSTASISGQLGISPQTVKVFRRQLYAKCGISSQAELFSLMLPMLGA